MWGYCKCQVSVLNVDVGWLPSQFRWWFCMVRYWSKLVCFEDDRITAMIFNLDDERCRENWFSEVIMIMNQIGLGLTPA